MPAGTDALTVRAQDQALTYELWKTTTNRAVHQPAPQPLLHLSLNLPLCERPRSFRTQARQGLQGKSLHTTSPYLSRSRKRRLRITLSRRSG